MQAQAAVRNIVLACMLGFGAIFACIGSGQLGTIADRLDTATIGGTRVPAVECEEDEVISWLGPDSLGCVHFEDVR